MKVSFIAPPLIYAYAGATDYHLIPVHHLTEYGDAPMIFYKMLIARGDYVILDNSVTERPEAADIETLLDVAIELGAHEIVLPDVFDNARDTVTSTLTAIAKLTSLKAQPRYQSVKFPKTMAVVHGKTEEQWLNTYDCFEAHSCIDVLGLPKVMEYNFEDRPAFLRRLRMRHRLGFKQCHVLGIWSDVHEITRIADQIGSWVRGIDTSLPIMLGVRDLLAETTHTKVKLDEDIQWDPYAYTTVRNMLWFAGEALRSERR